MMSRKVDECKPLELGRCAALHTLDLTRCSALASLPAEIGQRPNLRTLNLERCGDLAALPVEIGLCGRGLHSSTSQLNLSRF